jgi:hypothetical protein
MKKGSVFLYNFIASPVHSSIFHLQHSLKRCSNVRLQNTIAIKFVIMADRFIFHRQSYPFNNYLPDPVYEIRAGICQPVKTMCGKFHFITK